MVLYGCQLHAKCKRDLRINFDFRALIMTSNTDHKVQAVNLRVKTSTIKRILVNVEKTRQTNAASLKKPGAF